MFFYIDWLYIILVLPAVLFATFTSARVSTTFRKYGAIPTRRGLTGADAARRILFANGIYDVRVEHIEGNLNDHYDPRARVIRLSTATYGNNSAAAVGVAAHEAGHAVQHAKNYVPLKLRNAIVPVTNIGARLAIPLILIGILLSTLSAAFAYIAYIGVACFGLVTLFQLLTLPTEFNASKRALKALEGEAILDKNELKDSKRVLNAAAMTYVAALAVSFAQLFRFLLIVASSTRRRD
ncbi:MAG: zinc metallopeptidase [Clostridia bacterium]|nr:zinc metallopeptidase [Clostridia bacterium]